MCNAQEYCDGSFNRILPRPAMGQRECGQSDDWWAADGDIPAIGFSIFRAGSGHVTSLAGNNLPNWNRYRRPESLKGARGQKTPHPSKGKRTALPQSGLRFSFAFDRLSSLFSKGGGLGEGFLLASVFVLERCYHLNKVRDGRLVGDAKHVCADQAVEDKTQGQASNSENKLQPAKVDAQKNIFERLEKTVYLRRIRPCLLRLSSPKPNQEILCHQRSGCFQSWNNHTYRGA